MTKVPIRAAWLVLSTPSKTQKIHMQCPVAQLIPVHGTKPSQRLVTSPPPLDWTTLSSLKWGIDGLSALHYLRCMRGEMLKILDLSRDFSGLQAGFAELSSLHQVISLGIEDANLVTHFSQLVVDGMITLYLSQNGPIVQPCGLFPELVVLWWGTHKLGSKPAG